MNRDFKGIWVPKEIWLNKELSWIEKFLLVEIDSLDNEEGCWASNEYFSNFFGVSKDRISKLISGLNKKGYITVKLVYKDGTKAIDKRIVKVTNRCRLNNLEGIGKNAYRGIGENNEDNNTYINNTINNTMSSCEQRDCVPYKEIIEYLNTKANSNYKHTTAATQKCIKARWNEGFRLDDFKRVVDIKVASWINDEKFSKFLRPQTLFSNKFESYLNEKPVKQSNKQVVNNQYSNKNIEINKPMGVREQERYLDEDELRIRRIIQEEAGMIDYSLEEAILADYLFNPKLFKEYPSEAEWYLLPIAKEIIPTLYICGGQCETFIDLHILHKELNPKSKLELSKFQEYALQAKASRLIGERVKQLRINYYERKVRTLSESISECYDKDKAYSLQKSIDNLELAKSNLSTGDIEETFEEISESLETPKAEAVKTFVGIDTLLGGGMYGDNLITIGARPSVGKSALAMTSMVVEAFKNNDDIAIDLFSLEMSKRSVINRILCNRLNLSYHTFLNPYKFLDEEQKQAVRNDLDKIAQEYDLKIYTAGIKLDGILREIRTRARDAKQAGKKYFAVIDYVQLVKTGKRYNDLRTEATEVSRELRLLSTEMEIPIIILSQLNRGVEGRQDKTPQLSDLKEAGAIEQDSTVVAFLSLDDEKIRENNIDLQTSMHKPIKLSVQKNRDGKLGTVYFNFIGKYMQFIEEY